MKSLQVTSWLHALVHCIQDSFDILLLNSLYLYSGNLVLQWVQEKEKPNRKQGCKGHKKWLDGNWGGLHVKMWTPEIWMWQRFRSSAIQHTFFMLCIVYHLQDKNQMETKGCRKKQILRSPYQPCTLHCLASPGTSAKTGKVHGTMSHGVII